jgi:hypothetical protein
MKEEKKESVFIRNPNVYVMVVSPGFLSTAMKALQPLRKALTGTIKEEALPALVGDIMEVIKVKIWNVLDESASDIYAETVPPMPSPPLQRDENGVQTEALANAFGK